MSALREPSFSYEAFGLKIGSQLELWPGVGLEREGDGVSSKVDVDVSVAPAADTQSWTEGFELHQPIAVLHWPQVGVLRISDGHELCWRPEPHANAHSLSLLSAGIGLAMLLSQRGKLVLHGATVVSPRGDARCLIGHSGAGKSSLVATLLARGWSLLSDAMTAIEFDGEGRAWALRGVPLLRLWPDVIARAGLQVDDYPRVTPGHDKRVVPASNWSSSSRAELTRIYCLLPGAEVTREEIRGAAAALALVPQHFLAELLSQPSAARLLADSSRVARTTAIYSLCRGQSPADIPGAADCI